MRNRREGLIKHFPTLFATNFRTTFQIFKMVSLARATYACITGTANPLIQRPTFPCIALTTYTSISWTANTGVTRTIYACISRAAHTSIGRAAHSGVTDSSWLFATFTITHINRIGG